MSTPNTQIFEDSLHMQWSCVDLPFKVLHAYAIPRVPERVFSKNPEYELEALFKHRDPENVTQQELEVFFEELRRKQEIRVLSQHKDATVRTRRTERAVKTGHVATLYALVVALRKDDVYISANRHHYFSLDYFRSNNQGSSDLVNDASSFSTDDASSAVSSHAEKFLDMDVPTLILPAQGRMQRVLFVKSKDYGCLQLVDFVDDGLDPSMWYYTSLDGHHVRYCAYRHGGLSYLESILLPFDLLANLPTHKRMKKFYHSSLAKEVDAFLGLHVHQRTPSRSSSAKNSPSIGD